MQDLMIRPAAGTDDDKKGVKRGKPALCDNRAGFP